MKVYELIVKCGAVFPEVHLFLRKLGSVRRWALMLWDTGGGKELVVSFLALLRDQIPKH